MNTFQFSPGLTQLRDWAREKQDDSDVPAGEREVWKKLADEIDAFHDVEVPSEPAEPDLFGGPR